MLLDTINESLSESDITNMNFKETELTLGLPLSESDITNMNFKETELTLGLPGSQARSPAVASVKSSTKRGFIETVGFSLGNVDDERQVSGATNNKAQVVGWPPVRSSRKKAFESSKYIKVAVDGAPYLRKVDLERYGCYQELLKALEKMFACFTICYNYLQESMLMDPVKGTGYVPTYEDKDGDWMLVGDVPWKMFIESCKRIRLKKS